MRPFEVKIQSLKKETLSELSKKESEIRTLKMGFDSTLSFAKQEILAQAKEIQEKHAALEREEERIDRHRERMEEEIDDHLGSVIDSFSELSERGKNPLIVDAYITACFALDEKLAKYFEKKKIPAPLAAETIRLYKKQDRDHLQRIRDLEYQLSELWAKDTDTSEKEEFDYIDDDEDRTKYFLTKEEYASLSESERNQRALDVYLRRKHTKAHVGKMFERYVGYRYEKEGYTVEYRGIKMGLKDGGIDLICRKGGDIQLVQCKNWSMDSTIYEKHICQLYGASKFYDKDIIQESFSDGLFAELDWDRATPVFVATTKLDDHALEVAKKLGVVVQVISFDKNYPIIKCNINNGERIYHLPFDQMYDYTMICKPGEFYASTVKEAEDKGFRRAHKWLGDKD